MDGRLIGRISVDISLVAKICFGCLKIEERKGQRNVFSNFLDNFTGDPCTARARHGLFAMGSLRFFRLGIEFMKNSSDPKLIYFAGKVSKGGGYRGKLLKNNHVMSIEHERYTIMGSEIIYGGPLAIACDHGCFHGRATHGSRSDWDCVGTIWTKYPFHSFDTDGIDRPEIVRRCFNQIKESDGVHCYIDTISCYGTLAELGYANALSKPIRIFISRSIPKNQKKELWFVLNMPGDVKVEEGDATSFSDDFLVSQKSYKERYHEYLQSEEWSLKRLTKLQEAGYRCQLCNSKGEIHVHHRTYDRVFNELQEDLIALCSKCHEKFHDIEKVV